MNEPPRVAIATGGMEPERELWLPHIRNADRVIAANGGFRLLHTIEVVPDAVVGDLDSLDEEERSHIERLRIPCQRHPRDKDASDLELALELARSWAARKVTILSSLGGRVDHLMFTLISNLCYCRDLGLPATVCGPSGEVFLVDGRRVIEEREGWTCSFLALSPEVTGVKLQGFRYELDGESLYRVSSRGLSNVVSAARAEVGLENGLLVAMLLKPEFVV